MDYTKYIETVDCLVDIVKTAEEQFDEKGSAWFRGENSNCKKRKLLPSVFRDGLTHTNETDMTQLFRLRAPVLRKDPPQQDDLVSWLSLMQHYGLPTRLLDWTRSILVAAFFAVEEGNDNYSECCDECGENCKKKEAVIWMLYPKELNKKEWGDGSHLIYTLDHREKVDKDGNEPVYSLLEKAFAGANGTLDRVVGVLPAIIDIRMQIQQSVFTLHGRVKQKEGAKELLPEKPLNKRPRSRGYLKKYIIRPKAKKNLRKSLERLGISRTSLYPDMENLAVELKDKCTNK